MSNVIPFKSLSEEFTREVPEEATLLQLATQHSVRAFQMEHAEHGFYMCMVHFDHGGWHHIYQDGDGIYSKHLFFWFMAWQDDRSAEEVVLDFFEHKFILSE